MENDVVIQVILNKKLLYKIYIIINLLCIYNIIYVKRMLRNII